MSYFLSIHKLSLMLRKIIEKITFYFILLTIVISCADKTERETDSKKTDNIVYDSILAKKLNADEYGMGTYVIAFLKRGPNRPEDPAKSDSLQKEHLKNIERLANKGKLLLAGPFLDNGDLRGIYIFDVETIEEAKRLTETDPAIQYGSLVMELHAWYGSAAIREINTIHSKIQKSGVVEE